MLTCDETRHTETFGTGKLGRRARGGLFGCQEERLPNVLQGNCRAKLRTVASRVPQTRRLINTLIGRGSISN
jgi:hypothetical protein